MLKKILLLLLISLVQIQGRLIYNNFGDSRKPQVGLESESVQNDDWPINQTVTFVSNISSLIPENCYLPADQWIVRSGYAMAQQNSSSSFGFIFYGAQAAKGNISDLPNHPVMVWLQGGPGSSSQFGNFQEMGPLLVTGKGKNQSNYNFTCNPYTWNLNYSMIFIDNPVGTGLSHAQNSYSYPTNQDQVAEQFYYALVQLYTVGVLQNFTQSDFFIFGESYAGKFVPSIAEKILQMNQNSSRKLTIPLKGIGVGDGFTDPKTITDTFGIFGYNLGLIDLQEQQKMQSMIFQADQQIFNNQWLNAKNSFNEVLDYLTKQSGMNDVYNFENQETPNTLDLSQFLNQQWTKQAYGLPQQLKYSDFSLGANNALGKDFMKQDCVKRLENVLATGLPVLYYNGQNDIIVCTPCTEIWLDKIKYSGNLNGQGNFYNANFQTWNSTVKGVNQVVGYYKISENLYFYTVNKAGHMVPSDQPEASLTLVTNWINTVLNK